MNNLFYGCKFCKTHEHASTKCLVRPAVKFKVTDVLVLSTADKDLSPFLPPVFEMFMQGSSENKVKFNCLLDTTSSRSYISKEILN